MKNPSSEPCRLKELREAQGLSQADLARRCGMARQALNIIESGQSVPSVTRAFQIADALGCSVEDLFPRESRPPGLAVHCREKGLPAGTRVQLARVRGRWIGLPENLRAQMITGLKSADAVLDGTQKNPKALPFRSNQELEANILVLGCDPALGILQEWMGGRAKGGRMLWAGASSQKGLDRLGSGEAHVAGVHFKSWTEDANPVQAGKVATPEGAVLVRFADWEQGWMVRKGNPKKIREAADLAQKGIRFVNREKGSGSRFLTDALLRKSKIAPAAIPGYEDLASTHAEGAEKVSAGKADAAVGLRAVALGYGLDFIPIDQVSFDLAIPFDFMGHPSIAQMLDLLQGRAFRDELKSLPGYETGETGKIVARLPKGNGP